jgi:hypothetical protein
MARKVFHSFHFDRDAWRVSQVRNMGVIEGQQVLSGNEWEEVKKGGDKAIQDWIDEQMTGRSCVVVLAGRATAGRKWVDYEIKQGWAKGKGVVAVYIHGLKDKNGSVDAKGANPFGHFTLDGKPFSTVVRDYDPSGWDSSATYANIKDNLEDWVEDAIEIRKNYSSSS